MRALAAHIVRLNEEIVWQLPLEPNAPLLDVGPAIVWIGGTDVQKLIVDVGRVQERGGKSRIERKYRRERSGGERNVVIDESRRIQRELIFAACAIERHIEHAVPTAQHGFGRKLEGKSDAG